MTALPPCAGLDEDLKRWEREDDQRGFEDEPEAAFVRAVQAAIDAIAAGALPQCGGDGPQHCGRSMIHEGEGRYVCAKAGCFATIDTRTGRDAAPKAPPAEAAVIGGGTCANCNQPVSTLDGKYACNSCGHCN